MTKKNKLKRSGFIILAVLLLFLVVRAVMPSWTPKLKGENSISEM